MKKTWLFLEDNPSRFQRAKTAFLVLKLVLGRPVSYRVLIVAHLLQGRIAPLWSETCLSLAQVDNDTRILHRPNFLSAEEIELFG